MPSGRLGHAALGANSDADLYTVPVNTVTTATVNLCNRGNSPVSVRVAIRNGAIANRHYLEYDAPIPGNGVLERTGIVMTAGEVLTVRASAGTVTARAHGFEEDA